MPVLANLGTPSEVLREKSPAALPQGLFFALQKISHTATVSPKWALGTALTMLQNTVVIPNSKQNYISFSCSTMHLFRIRFYKKEINNANSLS